MAHRESKDNRKSPSQESPQRIARTAKDRASVLSAILLFLLLLLPVQSVSAQSEIAGSL
jgi:hypothetical protein